MFVNLLLSFPRRRESSLLLALTLGLAACSTAIAETVPQTTAVAIPADQQAFLDTCEDWDNWEKPAPPFNVWANTYYVGTCGISSILITTNDGHVLIDSGTDKGADIVLENIRSLGFSPDHVEAILMSHEHFDHVGGMEKLQKATGAPIYATVIAANALRSGHPDSSDPQALSDHPRFPPVTGEIRILEQNTVVELGHVKFRPILTPGHSPGATSWIWEDSEVDVVKILVYADSMGPISADEYRFSDHPEYVSNFRKGIGRIASIERCLLLTPHPSASQMLDRLLDYGLSMAGRQDCKDYADAVERRLDARLEREAGGDQ